MLLDKYALNLNRVDPLDVPESSTVAARRKNKERVDVLHDRVARKKLGVQVVGSTFLFLNIIIILLLSVNN